MLIKSHFTNWKVQRNASEKVQRNAYICDRIPYHLLCGENVVAAIYYKNCIIPIISSHMAVGRNQTHVYHGSIRRLRVLLRWASITWECFSGEHQSPENPSQVSISHLRILLRWASITWESFSGERPSPENPSQVSVHHLRILPCTHAFWRVYIWAKCIGSGVLRWRWCSMDASWSQQKTIPRWAGAVTAECRSSSGDIASHDSRNAGHSGQSNCTPSSGIYCCQVCVSHYRNANQTTETLTVNDLWCTIKKKS